MGYLPGGLKRAVWIADADFPVPFHIRDASGATVANGETVPWPVRPEPTSGVAVHVLDFSDLRVGAGFTVDVGGARGHPFAVSAELYRPLTRDALAFFYLQRCGTAIDEIRAPGYGRPAGHPGDAAVPAWTGEHAERMYPSWSCPGRFDVSGGWYDAGDHGKYVTSGALAVWQLLATLDLRRRGAKTKWWKRTEALLAEECRWQFDWLLRMQVPAGFPLAGLAFHRVHGTQWAPLPCWPHLDPTTRVLHRPSTGATLHLAAAAAQGARVLRGDPPYARRLLDAAVVAYWAARTGPRLIAPDDQGAYGGGPYGDDDLADDVAWAAAELWLATGDPAYEAESRGVLAPGAFRLDGFDFDRVAAAGALDLAIAGNQEAAPHVSPRPTSSPRLRPPSRGANPTPPPTAGTGGPTAGSSTISSCSRSPTNSPAKVGTSPLHREGWTTCWAATRSARATSPAMAPTTPATSAPATSRTTLIRPSRRFLPARSPGGPTTKTYPGFPAVSGLDRGPPQCRYRDEPTSETTNDVCIRWNAPLVFMSAWLTP